MVNSQKGKTFKHYYKTVRQAIYRFLEQPQTKLAIAYHSCVFVFILASFVFSILLTIETYEDHVVLIEVVAAYEICLLCIFIIECGLRIWSCGSAAKYVGFKGKIKFMLSFYMIIDIVSIAATMGAIAPYKFASRDAQFELTMVRVTRFVQVFRIMRIDRQRGDFRTMASLIFRHNKELITSYYIGAMVLILSTFLVYIAEKETATDPGALNNLADTLYWGIITVTTVGYGDFSPTGWIAKFITSIFALVGSALFAIPVGIISSGFALEVAKERRKQQEKQIRGPAAAYIQCWWKTKKSVFKFRQFAESEVSNLKHNGMTNNPSLDESFISTTILGVAALARENSTQKKKRGRRTSHQSMDRRGSAISAISLQTTRKGSANEYAATMTQVQHLALIFYSTLKETAALRKFERAKKPFIQLEDIITTVNKSHFTMMRKITDLDKYAPTKEVAGNLEALVDRVNELESQLTSLIDERRRQNDLRAKGMCGQCNEPGKTKSLTSLNVDSAQVPPIVVSGSSPEVSETSSQKGDVDEDAPLLSLEDDNP